MKFGQKRAFVLALLVVVVGFYIFHARRLETRTRELEAFKRLSEMPVYSLNGERVTIGALIKGRPSVLAFVAPNCGHCQVELSTLDQLSAIAPKNVSVIVVADTAHHSEEECSGAGAYLAALNVHRAKLFGRCDAHNGRVPFDRLVDQVMTQPSYNQARRVFWIVDNGSAHRGACCVARWQQKYLRLVPVHASGLNQIEICFPIVQGKVLTPNDFPSLSAIEEHLLNFQRYYESIAPPFEWKFNRQDVARLLQRIKAVQTSIQSVAA